MWTRLDIRQRQRNGAAQAPHRLRRPPAPNEGVVVTLFITVRKIA